MFSSFENRAVISWDIVTKSDLHIGGHGSSGPADVDLPVLRNNEDYPIIPGSSIKGVLRIELERLLRGCSVEVCTIPDVCYSSRWLKQHPERKNKEVDPCLVCQIFGSGGNSSPARIRDATAGVQLTVIRDGVAIDRKSRKAKPGSKYDLEAVPKGTVFSGYVTLENCSLYGQEYARLGGFLSLVDFFNACAGTMGHGVSRGYGEVEISIKKVKIISAHDYLNGKFDGTVYEFGTSQYESFIGQAALAWRTCVTSKKE
ncbi:RAMP superfamily CRISPR-associated protein [Methanospirillum hungatei]|uniref:RAMP superfamily CRISPR-associated protein n=1 Tax=Methanospirillum hungatei TaxID=2203 RepID=UPI0026EC5D66|nr:RAMP superfamily CRISPR-associated protein [Methanospirillum hungatei]MCA1917603.1 RAMP superfamily CRISPR-associated protein [Methanospirillum hungatei]